MTANISTMTNCTAGRFFTSLKKVKNDVRSTMTENQLNYLTTSSIETDILLYFVSEDIISDFISKKSRRIVLGFVQYNVVTEY